MSNEFSIDISSVSKRYDLPVNTLACTKKYNQSGIAGFIYIVVNAFKYLLSDSLAQSDWQKAKMTLNKQINVTFNKENIQTDPERITRLADRILYSLTYPGYKSSKTNEEGLYDNKASIEKLEEKALWSVLNFIYPYIHMNQDPETLEATKTRYHDSLKHMDTLDPSNKATHQMLREKMDAASTRNEVANLKIDSFYRSVLASHINNPLTGTGQDYPLLLSSSPSSPSGTGSSSAGRTHSDLRRMDDSVDADFKDEEDADEYYFSRNPTSSNGDGSSTSRRSFSLLPLQPNSDSSSERKTRTDTSEDELYDIQQEISGAENEEANNSDEDFDESFTSVSLSDLPSSSSLSSSLVKEDQDAAIGLRTPLIGDSAIGNAVGNNDQAPSSTSSSYLTASEPAEGSVLPSFSSSAGPTSSASKYSDCVMN